MKKRLLGPFLLFVFVVLSTSYSAQAQSTGQWITVKDDQTGQTWQCYQRYYNAQCVLYRSRPAYSGPVAPQPDYEPVAQPGVYEELPPSEPAYQTQRRRYQRRDLEIRSNGHRRLPSVRFSITTESGTLYVEGTPGYNPQIYTDSYGNRYYYPRW